MFPSLHLLLYSTPSLFPIHILLYILCTMMSMVMVASLFAGCGTDSGKENSASDTSKTKEAGTTISVAAIETAYGSEMWQKVADAFTEETGIKVELS